MATSQFPEGFEHGIDIREELAGILDRHGHQGYLRKITNQRCECFSVSGRDEADPDCPTCLGTGWGYLDYRVLMYRIPATRLIRGARVEDLTQVGYIGPSDAEFFLKTTIPPRQSDYILEIQTNDDRTIPQAVRIERVWDVNEVVYYRDRSGRIEYFSARCKRLDITK